MDPSDPGPHDAARRDARPLTRRDLLVGLGSASSAAALALAGASGAEAAARAHRIPAPAPVPAQTLNFNQGWRFGGAYRPGSEQPGYGLGGFRSVTLPHTVVRLGWGGWNPATWEGLWIYRKRFTPPATPGARIFLKFDGVMTDASVYLNGTLLARHQGGFLPFSVELTSALIAGVNDLGVVVDGRLLDTPPQGSPFGAGAIDYLTPAGIHRDVTLHVLPASFVSDVFAKPLNVLTAPELRCAVSVDSARRPHNRVTVTVELRDGARTVAHTSRSVRLAPGTHQVELTLAGLRGIELWSPSRPKLYTVRTTIHGADIDPHVHELRTGFREAVFELDGFYLNGERLEIFGLNRHELFPYVGFAAPPRLQAQDAVLLKNQLNVNMVRCSHYPQHPAFLDACDALGLMVWEEPPGWEYVGDHNFQAILLQNIHDMIVRDRNRPSVIVWGTRLDESTSLPTLDGEARAMAYALDGTRQTSGAMNTQSTVNWAEDVFAYDDYNSVDGNAQIAPPVPGVPYLISEAVGAVTGPPLYRWFDPSTTLATQARLHAQVHDQARATPASAGVIGWAAIDYASLLSGPRNWENLRWPGVMDTFRVPKPGAALYRSQLSPQTAAVIIPAFYWDFGPNSPTTGPGPGSLLFTNCEELEIYVNGALLTTATPDLTDYGHLAYPPVLADLTVDGTTRPELEVIGYVNGVATASLKMSADTTRDRLWLGLDTSGLYADGTDATRATFRALDAYGNQRPYVTGEVALSLSGPAVLVGDNPFPLGFYGGVGGVFLRSQVNRPGRVTLRASHPTLGSASAHLQVIRAPTAAL
ncbi:MAG TPA: glycoside hydrolase family 2 TIM barrel-domain containing protein [Solirubrobacteraceae bacterium]|nr:glycoside hydrolase family 2 TIM barrel-domain containing protein [Solirubrobacteraceae bacterium]